LIGKVAIVVKASDDALQASYELQRWLEDRSVAVEIYANVSETIEWSSGPESFPEDTDLIVVLGGDGTLLSAARHVSGKTAAVLGVNLGRLGFITEINLDGLYRMMELTLEGKYVCEERIMLRGAVYRNGKEIYSSRALNDLVINKGALARIIDMEVRVNGHFLNVYRADGLILCTPTGSTAYNMAAGGPILHPTIQSIVLTPICPFVLTNRPIILPAESTIDVEIGPEARDIYLTFDGQVGFDLSPKDMVRVERAENGVCLIKSPHSDYFEVLRNKLKWG